MKLKNRTVEFKKNTRNFFFHLLTACNLKCLHCYINSEQHGTTALDKETITQWLEIFAKHPPVGTGSLKDPALPEKSNVVFLGGEPTMHQDLAFAIEEAKRLGHGTVTLDTNGYLFNDILTRTSPELVDFISFSLDGSKPSVNDPIRGDGSFEKCVEGIKKAKKLGYNVSSIFTAHKKNIKDLPNMPALLLKLGVEKFFIQVVGIRGNPAKMDETSLQVERDEWELIVPETAYKTAEMGIHVIYPKVFLARDEKFECAGMVADNYFVFPNGRVYTCPLCEDLPIHAMEIKNGVLVRRPPVTEADLYALSIDEGCVMNKILHPGNIEYDKEGKVLYRIACCMLKEEINPLENN